MLTINPLVLELVSDLELKYGLLSHAIVDSSMRHIQHYARALRGSDLAGTLFYNAPFYNASLTGKTHLVLNLVLKDGFNVGSHNPNLEVMTTLLKTEICNFVGNTKKYSLLKIRITKKLNLVINDGYLYITQ
jgi:hypothetical protein